jgi:RNA polymerase sigma factor (sigma-70 family)
VAAQLQYMDETDKILISRYITNRDAHAFEQLVQKHGPMVRNVCLQILRRPHDADDAFQATFIVFAKKAQSIHNKDSLGSWLYGVALRTARRLRFQAQNRIHKEIEAAALNDDFYEESPQDAETWRLVHEELNELPEKYRKPIILCYLQGKTYTEAASELNLSYDETRGKLERGRNLLRDRLTQKSLLYSSVALAAFLSKSSQAAVPAALIQSTAQASILPASGKIIVGSILTSKMSVLSNEVIKGMFMEKIKLTTISIVAAVVVAGSGGVAVMKMQEVNRLQKQVAELNSESSLSRNSDKEKSGLLAENARLSSEIESLKKQLAISSSTASAQPILGDIPSKVIAAKIYDRNGDLNDEIVNVLGLTLNEKPKINNILKSCRAQIEHLIKSRTQVKESSNNKIVLEIQPYHDQEMIIKKSIKPALENIIGLERTAILYDVGTRDRSFHNNFINLFSSSKEEVKQITLSLTQKNNNVSQEIIVKTTNGMQTAGSSWDVGKPRPAPEFLNPELKFFDEWFPASMK